MTRFAPCCIIGIVLFLFACRQETPHTTTLELPDTSEIVGLATPIQLKTGRTKVLLADYFLAVEKIDSFRFSSDKIKASWDDKAGVLNIAAQDDSPLLSNLSVYVDGYAYDFLVKKSLQQKVRISYAVPPGQTVQEVQLVGDLNNWNPANSPMKKEGITWYTDLQLNPGRYPYQVVVDGEWQLDPANPEKISNGMGGYNSLLIVEKPDLNSLPFLYNESYKDGRITLGYTQKPTEIFAYWENYQLPTTIDKDGIHVHIPTNAQTVKRSHLRLQGYNEKGLSNDIEVPLEYGKPIQHVAALDRMDKEAMSMYFPLVDRFYNGNTNNDEKVDDDRLIPITNYMGGDIKGITKKIKSGYFQDLGINTLWLSPITQNPLEAYQEYPAPKRWYSGYHGYWPVSSSKVDHRFGTEEEMHELVKTAHDNDMNVLLDYVCNHVHIKHPIYQEHPEWTTAFTLEDGTKNIRIWDEQRLTTWFDEHIPTLDLSNPEVIRLQADSAFYWLKKYKLDGYRHDATKHIPEAFWRHLTRKIKEEIIVGEGREVYQIGETYGSHPLIASYIGSGMVDSQFDFNLHFTARDVFAKDDESFMNIANAMRETFDYYGYHHSMGNISGNHDQTRFMGLASGAVAFDEDAKEAGFTRNITIPEENRSSAFAKLANMHAFLMAIPGVPVIYYGDEIGMVGASDPDNRRMMRFDSLANDELALKATVEKLAQQRRNSMALMYGDTYMLQTTDDVLAFARVYFDEVAIIVFNQGKDNPIHITLPDFLLQDKYQQSLQSVWGNSDMNLNDNTLQVKIPAGQFDYIMN